MAVSLYEQFLAVGTVRSLMTGKDFSASLSQKNGKNTPADKQNENLSGKEEQTIDSQNMIQKEDVL